MRFFYCVAKALLKHGLKFAAKLAGVDAFVEFGIDVFNEMREAGQEESLQQKGPVAVSQEALRQQIQEVAPLSHEEAKAQAAKVVEQVAPNVSREQKQEMADYLAMIPPTIRQSLKRVADPSGNTVPATTRFQRVEDVLPFLPRHLPQFKPGDQPIAGVDLELIELLGRGGFGDVWKARNTYMSSADPVVLKFTTDDSAIKILRNEAGVLDRVMRHGKHPGIVPLLKTYLRAQFPCLEYEFVPGFDLSQLIRQWHAKGIPDWQLNHPWFVQLAEIIAFAHQADPPIVHCDLKPANIFVHRKDGGKARLRVLDFGIGGLAASQALVDTHRSANSKSELLTQAARGAYTPLYASPQQKTRRRDEAPDPRDDIHALGVIWYQMLTGDLTMTAMPTDWHAELTSRRVPGDVIELLGRCFSNKAERRPAHATELLRLLKKPPKIPVLVPEPPPVILVKPQPIPEPPASKPEKVAPRPAPTVQPEPSRRSRLIGAYSTVDVVVRVRA